MTRWVRVATWKSWHVYRYTSEQGRDIMYCGSSRELRDAYETDLPLPDGKTCETCLRVKAAHEGDE